MFLGKVGVMALYAKKKFDNKGKPRHQYLLDHQEKFQKQLKKKNIYTVNQYPKGAWFLGVLFMVSGISLFYILLKYDQGDLTLWWRYLIIIGMTLLGMIFLMNVDRMKYEIHKAHQILLIERMNPFLMCRKITKIKDLEQLEDIKIVKRGPKNMEYYAIQFVFKDSKVDTLEFNQLREVKLKYTEIITFLEQQKDLGNIKIDIEKDPLFESDRFQERKNESSYSSQQQDKEAIPLL